MNFDDVLALARAGFGREEILAIYNGLGAPTGPAPAVPATATAPAVPATATAPAVPATATAPAVPAVPAPGSPWDAVMTKMDSVLDTVKLQQIMSSQQPPRETAQDVLANILSPRSDNNGK